MEYKTLRDNFEDKVVAPLVIGFNIVGAIGIAAYSQFVFLYRSRAERKELERAEPREIHYRKLEEPIRP